MENLPTLPHHPLRQLREILDWSREVCARETGLKTATIQNIERGAAPLPDEAAFAIEAATGCNAIALMRSAAAWRDRANGEPGVPDAALLDRGEFQPLLLDGEPYTAEFYREYKRAVLQPQAVEKAAEDLSRRIKLLLGPLERKPEKFRRLYRYLVQVLNRAKKESGPNDAEMTEFAREFGSVKLEQPTLGELSQSEIAESPGWKDAKLLERYGPDARVHVVTEEMIFWPWTELIKGDDHYVVPDHVLGSRVIWRITPPDGRMRVIVQDRVHSGGLQAKLRDTPAKAVEAPAADETAAGD